MSSSIGLKTKSKEQAQEILKYINEKCPSVTELYSFGGNALHWETGDNLTYIEDETVVGINYSSFENLTEIYFYSILYLIANKFKAIQEINNTQYPVIVFNESELRILSTTNPRISGYGFIKIKENGLKAEEPGFFNSAIHKMVMKNTSNMIEKLR